MIKHVFFDLDRTLWDFETNTKNALKEVYEKLELYQRLKCTEEAFISSYRRYNNQHWKRYLANEIDKETVRIKRFHDVLRDFGCEDDILAQQLSETYLSIAPYQRQLFPNVKETLDWLKDRDIRLAVITNGFKEAQEIKLKSSGIREYFDFVFSSEEVGIAKPDPQIFKYALQQCKAQANTSIMVGDHFETDVLGAEQTGIRGVLFDPHQNVQSRKEIDRITKMDELKEIILSYLTSS